MSRPRDQWPDSGTDILTRALLVDSADVLGLCGGRRHAMLGMASVTAAASALSGNSFASSSWIAISRAGVDVGPGKADQDNCAGTCVHG
ncbi:hypothetical protein ABIG06_001128 [Bradyrhizobium sp. USDA 326]|uniref:hypothetical protein n=1 Tax=Bradyrhizobium sp. USDA 326 TaxID=3377726 RepID=UPI003C78E9A0